MDYNFLNKVVLVTGASAGIGEATAVLLAKYGARLALVGRNEKNLKEVTEKCTKIRGVYALPIVADLSTDEGCEKTAKTVIEQFGRLDVLVNNAGLGGRDRIEQGDMELFDKLFNINVRGVYNLTRLLTPTIIESQGNIVNVSSIAGTKVTLGAVSYGMTKAAIDHFTRLIALELAPKGVRVNAVNPGLTVSDVTVIPGKYAADFTTKENAIIDNIYSFFISNFHVRLFGLDSQQYEKFIDGFKDKIPLGEVCTAEDIAKKIVHIASDHSRLVTGTTVQVDGGGQIGGR